MKENTTNTLLIISIFIIGVLCYYPSLDNYFIETWDDTQNIISNDDITGLSPKNIGNIFSSAYNGMYQPVTTLTYAINYSIHETRPFGYHLVNLLFHCINAGLIFLILNHLTGSSKLVSFLVSCFYLTHTFSSEPVAWVSARSSLITTTMCLIGFLYYIRKPNPSFWVLLVIYLLAILAKVNAFFLPLVFILFDQFNPHDDEIPVSSTKNHLILLAAGIPFIFIGMFFREANQGVGFWTLLFDAPVKILWYLNHLLPMYTSSPVYNTPSILDFRNIIGGFLIILPFLIAAHLAARNKKLYWFGILFMLIFLGQFLIQYSNGSPVADRYGYLALPGLCLLLASLLTADFKQKLVRIGLVIVIVSVIGINFYSTRSYSKKWKDDHSLWTYAEKTIPTNSTAKENLGSWLLSRGQIQEAKNLLVAASTLDSRNSQVHYNLGSIYFQEQNATKSLEHFNKAINLKPDFMGYLDRAKVHYAIRDYENTLKDVTSSLDLEATAEGLHLRGLTKFALNQDGCEDLRLAMGLGAEALSDFVKHCPNSPKTN